MTRAQEDQSKFPDTPQLPDVVGEHENEGKKPLQDSPPTNEDLSQSTSNTDSTPPTVASNNPSNSPSHPFYVDLKVDGMAVLLLVVGLFTRLILLEYPKHVVFDEILYGKHVSNYLKRTFFFDTNPPLGKMLIALVGYLGGFDGQFSFDKIGQQYSDVVPLWYLRLLPALCGSLLSPTVYLIMTELMMSPYTGSLAALMVLFDTALLTQSRFILMESMMMFFGLSALLCVLKFRKVSQQPFTRHWFKWLALTSLLIGGAFCVKYIGIYTGFLITFLIFQDFWRLLLNKSLTDRQLAMDFTMRLLFIVCIPMILYLGLFSLHLSILTKAGEHDNVMSKEFQGSLEGGVASVIRGQPQVVAHGSQVTLRHTHGKLCWLHSHKHVYPIRYQDGRGSSHQQQVSCYIHQDVNNFWIVKRPNKEDLAVQEPVDRIKHGDVIQLVHAITHRALNSHDVGAPVTPRAQEVSCYIDYNVSMAAENLWEVDIINRETTGDIWIAQQSHIRLIHVNTTTVLTFTGKDYPDWGFLQSEVVTARSKNVQQADTVWNVEEHRYTVNDKDKETIERELAGHEMIPEADTSLSFWDKFLELQFKMMITYITKVHNHNFASDPSEWPFLTRGVAYFIAKDSNRQVHLVGNLVVWYTATVSLLLYSALLVFYLLRRQRLIYDIDESELTSYISGGEVLLSGYLFHYLPYYFCDRTLFLYDYLPAYIYKLMLTAHFLSHCVHLLRVSIPVRYLRVVVTVVTVVWVTAVISVFGKFSVLSYAHTPLTAEDVRALQWKDTWEFIVHRK